MHSSIAGCTGRQIRLLRSAVRRSITRISCRSDLVIGVSASVLSSYVGPETESLVVRNCAPDWFSDQPVRDARSTNAPTRVMHGKVIPSNGTSVVVAALECMGTGAAGVQVVMLDVSDVGNPLCCFGPSVDHVSWSGQLGTDPGRGCTRGDAGTVGRGRRRHDRLRPRARGRPGLPNRLFEYMAAGLAILAPTYATEIGKILTEEDIGVVADFDDPVDVARALGWLRDHPEERRNMGARARRAFVERHSWQQEFDKLSAAMKGGTKTCAS